MYTALDVSGFVWIVTLLLLMLYATQVKSFRRCSGLSPGSLIIIRDCSRFATARTYSDNLLREVRETSSMRDLYRKIDSLVAADVKKGVLRDARPLESDDLSAFSEQNDDDITKLAAPPPPLPNERSYDALALVKNVRMSSNAIELSEWLKPFELAARGGVVFTYDGKGAFLGDVFVRFKSRGERDKCVAERNGKQHLGRSLSVYVGSPAEYEQYFFLNYRSPRSTRSQVDMSWMLLNDSSSSLSSRLIDMNGLKTGMILCGRVVRVMQYGVFMDCGVVRRDDSSGRLYRRMGLLHRKDVPRNVGLSAQDKEFLIHKDVVLSVGVLLRVVVAAVDPLRQQRFWLTLDTSTTPAKLEFVRKKRKMLSGNGRNNKNTSGPCIATPSKNPSSVVTNHL